MEKSEKVLNGDSEGSGDVWWDHSLWRLLLLHRPDGFVATHVCSSRPQFGEYLTVLVRHGRVNERYRRLTTWWVTRREYGGTRNRRREALVVSPRKM